MQYCKLYVAPLVLRKLLGAQNGEQPPCRVSSDVASYTVAFSGSTPSKVSIPAELRVYSPPSESATYPNHTAALVLAKALHETAVQQVIL